MNSGEMGSMLSEMGSMRARVRVRMRMRVRVKA